MGGQPFAMRQNAGNPPQRLRPLGGNLNQAGALLEVIHTQGAGKTGGAAGGQDVVRAGAIIAQAL